MLRRWMMLAAPLALVACQKPETPEQTQTRMTNESSAAKATIAEMATAYGQHLTAHHPDSVAAMFTENGIMMPPNGPAVAGRDHIKESMTRDPLPPGSSVSITSVDVVANGPLAVDRGTYQFTMPAMGRTPAVNVAGKYLNHLHMVDGKWKIAASMWSDDMPAMTMPQPPAHNN